MTVWSASSIFVLHWKLISVKMYYKLFLLLIFGVYICVCDADNCEHHRNCGACISNPNCVWCSTNKMEADKVKCMSITASNNTKNWCDGIIENPVLHNEVIKDESFDKKIGDVQVQFRPQLIKIKTRPGVPVPITMSYQPAKDYPLDVYFVMDISYTMESQRKNLYEQANEIYQQMINYTNNVRFGLGSFVEKPGYPYVDVKIHKSHAFRNHLSLTTNMTAFAKSVKDIKFGANFDDPEAGLDALMQTMKCEKELGWRQGARRIIVLCTDATYHSAGDGKVLGVIRPNDMQCHLDNNLYNATEALTYDYPSISQINTVAKQGNFIIIFAVKKAVAADYTILAKHILGSQYRSLDNKYGTVEAIKEVYKESAQFARVRHDLPPYIQLTTDQNCDTNPTRNCESTVENRTVHIKANLTVQYCPPDGKLSQELEIKILAIEDILKIQLDIDCQCDCEKGTKGVKDGNCNNAGLFQCGICHCDPERYGVDCRCSGASTDDKDIEKCRPLGGGSLCSGRGTCRCGKCENCTRGFSGDLCEFNDESCPHMCKGNGICTRGACQCNADWTGEDCGCPVKTDACVAPYSKELCAGNGICECGRCKCNYVPGKNETYSGKYCDDCDDCPKKRCKELENYVICNVQDTKSACDKKYDVTNTIVEFVNKTELKGSEWYQGKLCQKKFENGSILYFKYKYDNLNLKLGIQTELELPAKANVYIAVGSAIGIVLLIGILTLIVWKILVDIHDKKEYEKFSKEAQAQGYDVSSNPLYSPPQVNFHNPAFQQ